MNSNENEDFSYELGRAQQSHIGHVGYWSPGLSIVSRLSNRNESRSSMGQDNGESGRLSSLWARIRGETEAGQDARGGGGSALDLTDDSSNLEYLLSAQNGIW